MEVSFRTAAGLRVLFLGRPEEDWPANVVKTAIRADYLEVRKEDIVNVVNVDSSPDATSCLMAYFSDWRKLKVAAAWFLKLKRILLEMTHRRHVPETLLQQEKQGPKRQALST